VSEGTLQGGLHLHLAEFFDVEVQVLEGFSLFIWIMLQQQLGELEPGEGELRAEFHIGGYSQ